MFFIRLPRRCHSDALILVGALALTPVCPAAVPAVSNLAETPGINQGVAGSPVRWVAESFLTGASLTMLDSVDLRARFFSGVTTGFTVSLYADDNGTFGGQPGALLSLLSGPDPTVDAVYNYTDPVTTALAANTPYWIVVKNSTMEVSDFGWRQTGSAVETGLPGWSILDTAITSGNSGASWSGFADSVVTMFGVNVVPESSTWAATGALALLAAGAWRRGARRA